MKEITITFTETELEGIKLALETAIEYHKEAKSTISGALIGHSRIDDMCHDIETIKEKIELHRNSNNQPNIDCYSHGYDNGMIDALIMVLKYQGMANKYTFDRYLIEAFGWDEQKAESYKENVKFE